MTCIHEQSKRNRGRRDRRLGRPQSLESLQAHLLKIGLLALMRFLKFVPGPSHARDRKATKKQQERKERRS